MFALLFFPVVNDAIQTLSEPPIQALIGSVAVVLIGVVATHFIKLSRGIRADGTSSVPQGRKMGSAKPTVPKAPRKRSVRLEKEMIAEAGGLCAWCRLPEILEIHHIDEDRSNTVSANLVALCANCHGKAARGFPSPADLAARKLELQWQRTAISFHSPKPERKTVVKIKKVVGGQVAGTINNTTYRGVKPPRSLPATDSIEANAAMKTYVQYLVERYIWCRMEEQKHGDPRRFHPAMAKNIVKKAVGVSPYGAPQNAFPIVTQRLVALVCRTKWAKQIKYAPHSWEQHQANLTDGNVAR